MGTPHKQARRLTPPGRKRTVSGRKLIKGQIKKGKSRGSLRFLEPSNPISIQRPRHTLLPFSSILRIRTARTHLKPVNPAVNIATTVLLFMPLDVGEAGFKIWARKLGF